MSVSQSASGPRLAGGLITMNTIQQSVPTIHRRTKIVCTLGPASWDHTDILCEAGMNVARLNFSHGDFATHKESLDKLRATCQKLQKNVAVLLDTKGPEIRTGFFEGDTSSITLQKGDTVSLTSNYHYKGNAEKFAVSYKQLAESVRPGQIILIADGSLVLTVLSCDKGAGEVACRVENTATIGERKNMNLPGVDVDLPTFTDKDREAIIDFGVKHQCDFIAASFVRKKSDIECLRRILAEHNASHIKVIAKIENEEGLRNYPEILAAADGIMVARGDLGMELPSQKVFLAQKYMIREANVAGKFVITATQMLESMIQNPRPTRAECSDVANAVLDGTDCVMLSGETANSPYFEQAVRVMAKTCCEAEQVKNYNSLFAAVRRSVILKYDYVSPIESLASSAVKTAIDIGATLIVVLSESGQTARLIAKYRPRSAIICLTNSGSVARQCSGVMAGVHGYVVKSLGDPCNSQETGQQAVLAGIAKEGDKMVIVSGTMHHGKGGNNQIRVEAIQSTRHTTADGASFPKLRSFVVANMQDQAYP